MRRTKSMQGLYNPLQFLFGELVFSHSQGIDRHCPNQTMRPLIIAFIMPLVGLVPVSAVPKPEYAGPSPVYNSPALVRRFPGVAAPSSCPLSRRETGQEYRSCDGNHTPLCCPQGTYDPEDSSVSKCKRICSIKTLATAEIAG